jgi:hypothetical protein
MTPCLRLIRLEEDDRWGTMGMLLFQERIFCATLEPSDVENAVNVSSIPAQQYWCERYSSPKFPNTYRVRNVPGRSKILFHAGNTIRDTAGCIILGQRHSILADKERAMLNSGDTFSAFLALTKNYELLHLTIRECY